MDPDGGANGGVDRYRGRWAMFVAWRRTILEENARRKAVNEVAKTRIALEVKDLKESD